MVATPTAWIKQVKNLIMQSKEIPMWGTFLGFPWEEFGLKLKEKFSLNDFEIKAGTCEWKTEETLFAGMGQTPLQISIELTPIQGTFSLIVPIEDFTKLSSWMIHPKVKEETFSDPFLQKGFFHFIALEMAFLIDQMQLLRGLTPKLIEMPLTKEEAYSIDISLKQGKETAWARLIFPTLFQTNFKKHFANVPLPSFPSKFYDQIDVDIMLSCGKTSLLLEEAEKIREGDFIFLDQSSYSPSLKRGTFQLVFNGRPLFQVKLKDENVKILDYALYYEENGMIDPPFDDESLEKEINNNASQDSSAQEKQEPSSQMISPSQVPISLNVEIARLKMNLNKLLQLKPGNILELSVLPQQGVRLVTDNKCIAEGELIQIGDVIGVKITKIGN